MPPSGREVAFSKKMTEGARDLENLAELLLSFEAAPKIFVAESFSPDGSLTASRSSLPEGASYTTLICMAYLGVFYKFIQF
jgi:hypothetical protein